MYLTREEEQMLDGEYGEAVRLAMRLIVKIGEALGAEKLVKIRHAHISGISYVNIGDYGLEFIEELYRLGARFTVTTTFNPTGVPLGPSDPLGLKPHIRTKQFRLLSLLLRMGAHYTATCTPYEIYEPKLGDHLAWGESSAVAVANGLYGARTNREGGPIALAAAVTGRIYYWGLHIDEERKPDTIVRVDFKPSSEVEAGLAGYIVASVKPTGKLYVESSIGWREAVSFCAAAAAQGSIALCHFPRISPEKLAPIDGVEKLSISLNDVATAVDDVSCSSIDEAEVYFIGCPHYGPKSIGALLAELNRLKKLAESMPRLREVWVAVPGLRWRYYVETIPAKLSLGSRTVDVKVMPGTCIVVTDKSKLPPIATPSVKTAIYLCKAGVKTALAVHG